MFMAAANIKPRHPGTFKDGKVIGPRCQFNQGLVW
jgi:hypothetical protein